MLTGSQREQLFIRTSPAGGGPGAAGAGAEPKHVIENSLYWVLLKVRLDTL